jgi:hypothetical protein
MITLEYHNRYNSLLFSKDIKDLQNVGKYISRYLNNGAAFAIFRRRQIIACTKVDFLS